MQFKWLFFVGLLNFFSANAQVESTAYGIMLQSMLSHSVPEINVQKADSLLQQGTVFIDAREKAEYGVSAIKNAVFVGYDSLDLSAVSSFSKNTPLVVYCSVGYRSEKVSEKLLDAGFTEVYNLYGGIFEWVNQGKPVFKQGESTQQVHGFSTMWGIWLNKGEKVFK